MSDTSPSQAPAPAISPAGDVFAPSRGSAAPRRRCAATVWKRDCLRYTGRGPGGFSMHYTEKQCGRTATHGEWCFQHHSRNPIRCRWAEATASDQTRAALPAVRSTSWLDALAKDWMCKISNLEQIGARDAAKIYRMCRNDLIKAAQRPDIGMSGLGESI